MTITLYLINRTSGVYASSECCKGWSFVPARNDGVYQEEELDSQEFVLPPTYNYDADYRMFYDKDGWYHQLITTKNGQPAIATVDDIIVLQTP